MVGALQSLVLEWKHQHRPAVDACTSRNIFSTLPVQQESIAAANHVGH